MDILKCLGLLLAISLVAKAADDEDNTLFDRSYRALSRVYEECHQRNMGLSPCLKKKAIAFVERLGKLDHLPVAENLEFVKDPGAPSSEEMRNIDLDSAVGRTVGVNKDELLNEILFEKIASLMNQFNLRISLPKTNSDELKRSVEEGRGKMKKMMGMMMTGMAMKMAALVPIAMGVLFLLAGKALIISKIALVLSMIIGLKKLLSQKNQDHGSGGGGGHGGWQQGGGGGGGWDRSFKDNVAAQTESDRDYAHSLAYRSFHQQ